MDCSECGKPAKDVRRYSDGLVLYVHESHQELVGGMVAVTVITALCAGRDG